VWIGIGISTQYTLVIYISGIFAFAWGRGWFVVCYFHFDFGVVGMWDLVGICQYSFSFTGAIIGI
jgi:hypothetical protein